MNYLTRLTAQGLKAGDFIHELQRVNLIVGPSFSGKSSRIEAIRLALIGYVPELGKQAGSTLALARNGHLTVQATDSAGRTNWREWRRKGESATAKADCQMSECPPVLMDPTLYFQLSDAKKIEYVFGLYQMDEDARFSGPAISAAIQNIRPEPATPHTEAIRRELIAEIDMSDDARHDAGQPIQAWLGEEIAELKDRLKLARQSVDRMAKAGLAITQLSSDDIPVDRASEIAAKRTEMAAIQESIGSLEQSVRQFEAKQRHRTVIEQTVPSIKPTPDHAARLAQIDQRIEQLESETDAGLNVQIETLTQTIAKLELQTSPQEPSSSKEEKAINELRWETGKLEAKAEQMAKDSVRLATEMSEKLQRPCCPECGAEGPEMRDRISIRYHQQIEALDKERQTAAESLSTLQIGLAEAQRALDAAQSRRTTWRQQCALLADARAELQRTTSLRADAAMSRQREIGRLRKEADHLQAETRSAERANQGRVEALARLRAIDDELAGWNIESIQRRLFEQKQARQTLEVVIGGLMDRQRAWERLKADEQRQAQAAVEQDRAKAEVAVVGLAIDALETIQSEMVAAAFGEILKVVNRITDGIIDAPIEYRAGQIGRWSGSSWVGHETFSGTEKALTYAGISLALARHSPVALVMIDELGRLDDGNLVRLLKRMVELANDGVVGQFIGCLSDDTNILPFMQPGIIEGVNLIDLTK